MRPKYLELAERYSSSSPRQSQEETRGFHNDDDDDDDGSVIFCQMELDAVMAPLIKLSIQNTPSFILLKGDWCTTIIGPDLSRLEQIIKEHKLALA